MIDIKTVKACRDLIMAEAWEATRPGNGTRPYSDGLYLAAQMLGDLLVEVDRIWDEQRKVIEVRQGGMGVAFIEEDDIGAEVNARLDQLAEHIKRGRA